MAHILPWERALMHTGGRSHGVSHQLRFIECQAQGLAANVLTFCGFCDVQQMVRSGMRAVARSKGLRLPQQMLVSEQQANKLPAPQGGCRTSTSNESCPLQLMPAAAKWTTNVLYSETAATMLYPEQLRHCRFTSEQWRERRVAMWTTECNTRSGMQQTTSRVKSGGYSFYTPWSNDTKGRSICTSPVLAMNGTVIPNLGLAFSPKSLRMQQSNTYHHSCTASN